MASAGAPSALNVPERSGSDEERGYALATRKGEKARTVNAARPEGPCAAGTLGCPVAECVLRHSVRTRPQPRLDAPAV